VPTLAVVIPTYRRPRELARCLAALALQTRPPDEVVVAAFDDPDAAGVADRAPLTCTLVAVDLPGAAAAMVAGTRATGARLICFTDDDAVPPPRWVERLEDALDDPTVGGAGGRDVVVDEASGRTEDGTRTEDVGRLTWYGRHVGGHHLAEGAPRDVAFLKGVNAAYRREALGLPVGLRGGGAEVHLEVAVGRYARRRGYRLVFDPDATVEHRPAPRRGDDQRRAPTPSATEDAAYNLVVALGGWRGLTRVGYATVVGDRGAPGLVRAAVALVNGDETTARRLGPSVRGTLAGGWAILRRRGVSYATFA